MTLERRVRHHRITAPTRRGSTSRPYPTQPRPSGDLPRGSTEKLPFFLRRKLEKIAHGRYMHALPVGLGKPASEPANSSESGVPKPAVRPLWGPHIRLTRTISRRRLTPPRIALLHEILCANRPNQRNSLGRSAADTPMTVFTVIMVRAAPPSGDLPFRTAFRNRRQNAPHRRGSMDDFPRRTGINPHGPRTQNRHPSPALVGIGPGLGRTSPLYREPHIHSLHARDRPLT